MTAQSPPSTTQSPTAGKASSNPNTTATLARIEQLRQQWAPQESDLSIAASLQNLSEKFASSEAQFAMNERSDNYEACEAERKQRERLDLALKLFTASGVPERHAKAKEFIGDGWIAKRDVVLSRLGSGSIIGLIGSRGTGKTQIAVQAVRETCRKTHGARYVKALDVFLAIRATYNSERQTEREVVKEFVQPSLLVIDEIHVRGDRPWEDMVLTHIIDKRYDAMRDTIIISNQEEPRFLESLGPSIVDRMHECGGVIECHWPSFRGEARP
jgi:DNA replication protein DnaC